MSKRWKYQLKWGLIWGSFMAFGTALFSAWENENWHLFVSWNFFFRLVVFNAVGIFVIGYFNWKEREKAVSKNS